MPEGDTLHRTAARLRPALVDRPLTGFDAHRLVGERPRPGDVVTAVEAQGKHLLVTFESGLVLQTHLRMSGSWHLYRAGSRWRKPAHLARVVLDVDGWQAVCFAAPTVRTYRRDAASTPIDHVGPDLCRPDVDVDAVLARIDAVAASDTQVGDVLLDQRIASGIGNVYKSEVCWACGVHPTDPICRVVADDRRRLVETAHRLLRANLGSGPRTTVPGGVAAYGRAGRPCRRCGTAIRSARTGRHRRRTYWCPTCQPHRDGGATT